MRHKLKMILPQKTEEELMSITDSSQSKGNKPKMTGHK